MEFRHLEVFVEVIRSGGFSAAARHIGSTQSSVSKAVSQLEHDCGETLVERLPHGTVPTEAGRIVQEHARAMLARREAMVSELNALQGLESGRLRLGIPLIGSGPLFASVLAEFIRQHPAIQIELQESGGQHLEEALQRGEVEIAASLLPTPVGFAHHQICNEPLMAVLPEKHPLAARDRLRLKDLRDTPCIQFAHGFALNSLLAAAYARNNIPLVPAARSTQPDFMVDLAAAGLGVTFLPALMVPSRPGIKAVRVDEPNFRWRLGLVWRSNSALSPAGRRFLDLTKKMMMNAK